MWCASSSLLIIHSVHFLCFLFIFHNSDVNWDITLTAVPPLLSTKPENLWNISNTSQRDWQPTRAVNYSPASPPNPSHLHITPTHNAFWVNLFRQRLTEGIFNVASNIGQLFLSEPMISYEKIKKTRTKIRHSSKMSSWSVNAVCVRVGESNVRGGESNVRLGEPKPTKGLQLMVVWPSVKWWKLESVFGPKNTPNRSRLCQERKAHDGNTK